MPGFKRVRRMRSAEGREEEKVRVLSPLEQKGQQLRTKGTIRRSSLVAGGGVSGPQLPSMGNGNGSWCLCGWCAHRGRSPGAAGAVRRGVFT